jgi:hypothetical protein
MMSAIATKSRTPAALSKPLLVRRMPFGKMRFANFPFVSAVIASNTVLNGLCRLVVLIKPPVFDGYTNDGLRLDAGRRLKQTSACEWRRCAIG